MMAVHAEMEFEGDITMQFEGEPELDKMAQ